MHADERSALLQHNHAFAGGGETLTAQQKQELKEMHYQALIDTSEDAIVGADDEGNIAWFSPSGNH